MLFWVRLKYVAIEAPWRREKGPLAPDMARMFRGVVPLYPGSLVLPGIEKAKSCRARG